MNKKIFYSLLLVFSLITGLCACGKDAEKDGTEIAAKEEANNNQTDNEDKVVIKYSLWGNRDREEYTYETIETFESLHPDIQVEVVVLEKGTLLTKQDAAMAGAVEADVMQIDYNWIERYSSNGDGFYDLSTLSDIIDFSQYDSNELKYGMSNGKLNAIPVSMTSEVPIYNKKLYDKYDLEIPKTWDDLLAAAEVMRADNIYPIIMTDENLCAWMLTYYMQLTGKNIYNENGVVNLDKESLHQMADMYVSLVENKVVCPPGKYTIDMLEMEKAAGIMCGAHSINDVSERMAVQGGEAILGYSVACEDAKIIGYYLKPYTMLAISKNTKDPEAAAELVEYLCNSKENALIQKTDKGVPSSRAAEMYLMQTGEMNNLSYKAKILIDYYNSELEMRPVVLDDSSFVQSFLMALNKYRYKDEDFDTTAKVLRELLTNK